MINREIGEKCKAKMQQTKMGTAFVIATSSWLGAWGGAFNIEMNL